MAKDKSTTEEQPFDEEPISSEGSAEVTAQTEEEAAAEAQRAADARMLPEEAAQNQMTYAEYDAIGKGENYQPSDEVQAHNDKADQAVEDAANAEPAPKL